MKNTTLQTPTTLEVCYKDFCTRATGLPAWAIVAIVFALMLAICLPALLSKHKEKAIS